MFMAEHSGPDWESMAGSWTSHRPYLDGWLGLTIFGIKRVGAQDMLPGCNGLWVTLEVQFNL